MMNSPVVPVPRCPISIRPATMEDLPFIDRLQKMHSKQVGWMPTSALEGKIKAAYGCRLFCCWCAQDIEANYFWESLGFIPLAFRAGSRDKGRVHIFWQRRIRAGDTTTPYWFPAQTSAGSIREDRLVFPIPPATHWSNAKPIILPATPVDEPKGLPAARQRKLKGT